jgi:tripartite-type tricarboxylate transporter receptor subunit TctC
MDNSRPAMKPSRRRFLQLASAAVALPASARLAHAQAYPNRPVRLIIGYTPGGSADLTARLMGQWLSEKLGQPFVVENRPGAGTNIATETVARSPADGYTLLGVDSAAAANATMYDKLNFNFIRDFAVIGMVRGPLVMVVHPSVPAKTVSEFIAYANANPGKVSMGSAGIGGTGHVSGELFQIATGVKMIHVPYRGAAPATSDLLGGQVQVPILWPARNNRSHSCRQLTRAGGDDDR